MEPADIKRQTCGILDAGPSVEEQAHLFLEAQDRSICVIVFISLRQLVSRAKVPVKMPPRRNRPLTEAYEQEFEQRVMARIEERLDQFVDQLDDRMNDMMNPRRRRDRNSRKSKGEKSENPRWESGMRVNILEFDGNTLNPKGFIDWLVAIEEVFEFKEVPENKRVSLIVTKLRSRASAWWQQLKLTRKRVRKPRVTSWKKMKKLLRENFIPHNYQRLMYQLLQNLNQGTKLVEDYTTKFYQLIARNDIQETEYQLVSRYIGGLRTKVDGDNTGPVSKGGDNGVADDKYEEPPVFDDDQYKEKLLSGDVGVNLKVRCSCLTPKAVGDDWLKHNIFQSTCRPWEYDRNTTHNGIANTYNFLFDGVKITLMPNKPKELVKKPTGTLLTLGIDVFVLIGKEVAKASKIPEAIIPLLEEFTDVFPDELLDGLPPLHDIQHHIDLEPGS
ncbi:putative reverse transcriptase domain-containing protein [Tanacetum coccineum]|uniref:Reverse transcriptase domain-containing protein n=1 Tax=Tanacetum coccineum TaxID=301880 RepID=A0ABQ5A8N9_9ASTR